MPRGPSFGSGYFFAIASACPLTAVVKPRRAAAAWAGPWRWHWGAVPSAMPGGLESRCGRVASRFLLFTPLSPASGRGSQEWSAVLGAARLTGFRALRLSFALVGFAAGATAPVPLRGSRRQSTRRSFVLQFHHGKR